MGLDHFTFVTACRSICLRFVTVVASRDARLDSRRLAGPWRGGNLTHWMNVASSGRTPLSSAGIAPLPRYYGPICQPWDHGGRSSSVLRFRYSSLESPTAFPSSLTHPFPGMPRSQTPAASPAQSPWPTPTNAFPILDTVGHCSFSVTGLDHFTLVAACRSLCLRFVVLVASHDAKLDCRWLAGPWRRRNCTSWIDGASSGRTQTRVKQLRVRI